MATTIQIVVAGILLLAWIWALGRPLAGSVTRSDYRSLDHRPPPQQRRRVPSASEVAVEENPETGNGDAARPADPVVGWRDTSRQWLHRPAEAWRRQLMLATVFAVFASFLLAIALRGSFIALFALMVLVLVIHLGVASLVGRRMLEVERAAAVRVAQRRVPRASGMSIRADRVGDLLNSPGELTDEEDPFAVAAELASQLRLDAESETSPVDPGATSDPGGGEGSGRHDLVVDDAGVSDRAAEGEDTEPDNAEDDDPEPDNTDPLDIPDDTADPDSEPIFRRAAKDEPARSRRKAKPIYIESQLDEDGGGLRPRAVNEQ
jgi:hypothetical protein